MWYQRIGGSKYRATSQVHNGIKYDSRKEAAYAAQLDLEKKAGEVVSWERQFKVSLDVDGYHICNHYVDFLVYRLGGVVELIEIKGFQTEIWRLKRKLLEATYLKQNPHIRYVVI